MMPEDYSFGICMVGEQSGTEKKRCNRTKYDF